MDPKDLKYKELITKLADDWNKGLSHLRFKLEQCKDQSGFGCDTTCFKSGSIEDFMIAMDYVQGTNGQRHAKIYADMVKVLTKPSVKISYEEIIKKLAADWCSGVDLLRLKLDIAEGREKEDKDSKDGTYGCYADDFKSGNFNSFFSALDYYPARDFSNEKQHAMVYRDMLAVMETMQLTGKHATGVVLDDIATRCMEDEPGPEDARFGKHDDQADALRHWRDVLNPPKHIDDTPARVETVYYNPPGNHTPTFEGTIPVSTTSLSFTTVNYVSINGGAPIDLSKLPADNIFSLIEQTEAEIRRLSEISNKPKALVKRIDDLQAGIDRLVAEIDGRDA